jgi:precorrin-2 dehydrogenase/sirohydrochlorin ferrochelatase
MIGRSYPIMSSRPALSVSLYVLGRRCLVIGEGPMAAERAGRLSAAGAEVILVPRPEYRAELLNGAFMAFCCDAQLGPTVSRDARLRGVLVYVLDQPALSDLAMPALVRRGPVQLAVSTDGVAPSLARRLRGELEHLFAQNGVDFDAFVEEMARLREDIAPAARREQLYEVASRLRIEGEVVIDPGDEG